MTLHVVVFRKERAEAAAVFEDFQRLLVLPRRRRQHQCQHDQIFRHVFRRETIRLFVNHRAPAAGDVQNLPVGMVAVAQMLNGLPVNLRGRHHPQHEAGLLLPVTAVHEVNRVRRQQRLAAARRDFQAEIWQRLADAVFTRAIILPADFFPRFQRHVQRITSLPMAATTFSFFTRQFFSASRYAFTRLSVFC